eukprot:scaffold978_cov172-Ochromonas_danica.AAC.26
MESLLDDCLSHLPADISCLVNQCESRWEDFLNGNLLDRLLFTLLNEEDDRIATWQTRSDVIVIFNSLVKKSHQSKVRVRTALEGCTSWIDDVLNPQEEMVSTTRLLCVN